MWKLCRFESNFKHFTNKKWKLTVLNGKRHFLSNQLTDFQNFCAYPNLQEMCLQEMGTLRAKRPIVHTSKKNCYVMHRMFYFERYCNYWGFIKVSQILMNFSHWHIWDRVLLASRLLHILSCLFVIHALYSQHQKRKYALYKVHFQYKMLFFHCPMHNGQ